MEARKRVNLKLNAHIVVPLAAAFVALLLIVLICIFAVSASNIRNEYSQARDSIGQRLYNNLYMLIRTYDGITLAGADAEGTIIPTMKNYYLAAGTLDDALSDAFGEHYRLLSATLDSAMKDAFGAFDAAFAQGRDTGDAMSSMSACVQSLEQLLTARFDSAGRLLSA